jgi:hypothetical protein
MTEQELRQHRRGYMIRLVGTMGSLSEQLLSDYERWVNKLSDAEFDLYLEEYASLGEHVWGQPRERAEDRGRKRPYVTVETYPLSEIPYRELLRVRRNEACIFSALALWKAREAKEIERAGPEAVKDGKR